MRARLQAEGSPLLVHAAGGDRTWFAYFAPALAPVAPELAVALVDWNDFPVPSEDALRRLFDFTAAEVRLAQGLATGEALERVAQSLGIQMSTARTQLASIFAKTGTRRQARLVALLSRVAHLSRHPV